MPARKRAKYPSEEFLRLVAAALKQPEEGASIRLPTYKDALRARGEAYEMRRYMIMYGEAALGVKLSSMKLAAYKEYDIMKGGEEYGILRLGGTVSTFERAAREAGFGRDGTLTLQDLERQERDKYIATHGVAPPEGSIEAPSAPEPTGLEQFSLTYSAIKDQGMKQVFDSLNVNESKSNTVDDALLDVLKPKP